MPKLKIVSGEGASYLYAHLHLVTLQINIQARDLGTFDRGWHTLRCSDTVECVAPLYSRVQETEAMALEDVH